MLSGAVISLSSQHTKQPSGVDKGNTERYSFCPIRHALEAPIVKSEGSYQALGKGPEGRYQNIEQVRQTTFRVVWFTRL